MKVHELITQLQTCNPNADVMINVDRQLSEYTWDTDQVHIKGILPWPEPKETANTIELTKE